MSSDKIFIEHQKHPEPPHESVKQCLSAKMNRGIKSVYAGSAQQSLRSQKVYEKINTKRINWQEKSPLIMLPLFQKN